MYKYNILNNLISCLYIPTLKDGVLRQRLDKIENGNKVYSYDYTILPLKLIFEFNGNHVHPSKELLGEKWNTWKCAWTGETADEKHSMDMEKISIAEKE